MAQTGTNPWIMIIPKKKPRQETSKEKQTKRSHIVGLPHIKNLSEYIKQIFKSYNVATSYLPHKPANTLKHLLVIPMRIKPNWRTNVEGSTT